MFPKASASGVSQRKGEGWYFQLRFIGDEENRGSLASLGGYDFFIFRCSLRPESSKKHLLTTVAEVLRLRA
jgi:hypothetical protein